MDKYILYNNDIPAAEFTVHNGGVAQFCPLAAELLPMQLRSAGAEGFLLWLNNRSIDLNTLLHRRLAYELLGTRDKLSLALLTHMYSISDTFTCFRAGEFTERARLCQPEAHAPVSSFILVSSDTSLRQLGTVTPNISTDGSFPKTWVYEGGAWWLYKLQSSTATRCEVEISATLRRCGWDAAVYRYDGSRRTRVKSLNFLGEAEFFEPYESFRYYFDDRSDDEEVIYKNLASLGEEFEHAWQRILLADAFFMNTDRHMRNFGVIRSSVTGNVLRLAPNFDNNQAYTANPGGRYSGVMLRAYMRGADRQKQNALEALANAASKSAFLKAAAEEAARLLTPAL